jgi:hypothetical protein
MEYLAPFTEWQISFVDESDFDEACVKLVKKLMEKGFAKTEYGFTPMTGQRIGMIKIRLGNKFIS